MSFLTGRASFCRKPFETLSFQPWIQTQPKTSLTNHWKCWYSRYTCTWSFNPTTIDLRKKSKKEKKGTTLIPHKIYCIYLIDLYNVHFGLNQRKILLLIVKKKLFWTVILDAQNMIMWGPRPIKGLISFEFFNARRPIRGLISFQIQ